MKTIVQIYRKNLLGLIVLLGLTPLVAWAGVQAQVRMSRVIDAMGQTGDFARVLVFFAAVLVIQAVAQCLYALTEKLSVFWMTRAMQLELNRKMTAIPYRTFAAHPRAELFSLWNNDIGDLQQTGVSALLTVLSTCLSAVLAAWQLWRITPLFCLLGVGFALVSVVPIRLLGKKNKAVSQAVRGSNIRTNAGFFELFTYAGLIKSYGREADEIQRFADANDDFVNKKVRSMMMTRFYKNTVSTLASVAPTAIIVLGARQAAAGRLSLGQIVLAIALLPTLTAPIGKAGDFWIGFQGLGYKWKKLACFFDIPEEDACAAKPQTAASEEDAPAAPAPLARPAAARGDGAQQDPAAAEKGADTMLPLVFSHVGYDADGVRILSDISFMVAAGEKVAIVGESGSGKTTLLHLALRLLEPTAGTITAGGRPLSQYDTEDYYARLYYAQSEVYILPASVQENLLLTGGTPQRMREAAARTGFDRDVAALPDGYDSVLAPGGQSLSGGQQKKLELTRALCAGRQVFFFDEVTRGIDPDGRQSIMDMLVGRPETMVFVTHSLEAVERMDRVLVLQNGRVQGCGTHEELLRGCAYYRALYEAQGEAVGA